MVPVPRVLVPLAVALQQAADPSPLQSHQSISVVQIQAVFRALVPAPEDFTTVVVLLMVTAGLRMGNKLNPTTVVPVVSLVSAFVTSARFHPLLHHRRVPLALSRIAVPS